KRLGGSLCFPVLRVNVIGIPNDRHASEVRSNLTQELQALGGEIGGNESHARDVASGTGEARHKAGLNRIVTHRDDDGDRVGCDPTRRVAASMSRNSSTHFPPNTEDIKDTPVMFPPGRAKLGTMPVSTGSAAIITIGISWVACFAASAQGTYSATITST